MTVAERHLCLKGKGCQRVNGHVANCDTNPKAARERDRIDILSGPPLICLAPDIPRAMQ